MLSWFVHAVYNRQARARHWHGLAGLPPYKHQRQNNQAQQQSKPHQQLEGGGLTRSETSDLLASGKHWSIDNVPIERKTLKVKDGLTITYYVMFPGNPKLQVLCNGLGVNANYTGE